MFKPKSINSDSQSLLHQAISNLQKLFQGNERQALLKFSQFVESSIYSVSILQISIQDIGICKYLLKEVLKQQISGLGEQISIFVHLLALLEHLCQLDVYQNIESQQSSINMFKEAQIDLRKIVDQNWDKKIIRSVIDLFQGNNLNHYGNLYLDFLIELNDTRYTYFLHKAFHFQRTNNQEQAISTIHSAQLRFPEEMKFLYALFKISDDFKHFQISIEILSKNLKTNPLNRSDYEKLIQIYKHCQIEQKITQNYEYLLIENNKSIQIIFIEAIVEVYQGNLGKAQKILKNLLSLNVDNLLIYRTLSLIAVENDNLNDAIKYWEIIYKNQPNNQLAIKSLVYIHLMMNQKNQACQMLKVGQRLKPNDFSINFELGKVLFDLNNFQEGYIYLKRSFEIDNSHLEQNLEIAKYLIHKSEQYAESVQILEHILKENPACSDAHYLMGYAKQQLRHFQQSRSYFAKAQQLSPENPIYSLSTESIQYFLDEKLEDITQLFGKTKNALAYPTMKKINKVETSETESDMFAIDKTIDPYQIISDKIKKNKNQLYLYYIFSFNLEFEKSVNNLEDMKKIQRKYLSEASCLGKFIFYHQLNYKQEGLKYLRTALEEELNFFIANHKFSKTDFLYQIIDFIKKISLQNGLDQQYQFLIGTIQRYLNNVYESSVSFNHIIAKYKTNTDNKEAQSLTNSFIQWLKQAEGRYSSTNLVFFGQFLLYHMFEISTEESICSYVYILNVHPSMAQADEFRQLLYNQRRKVINQISLIVELFTFAKAEKKLLNKVNYQQILQNNNDNYEKHITTHCTYLYDDFQSYYEQQLTKNLSQALKNTQLKQMKDKIESLLCTRTQWATISQQKCYEQLLRLIEKEEECFESELKKIIDISSSENSEQTTQAIIDLLKIYLKEVYAPNELIRWVFNTLTVFIYQNQSVFMHFSRILLNFKLSHDYTTFFNQIEYLFAEANELSSMDLSFHEYQPNILQQQVKEIQDDDFQQNTSIFDEPSDIQKDFQNESCLQIADIHQFNENKIENNMIKLLKIIKQDHNLQYSLMLKNSISTWKQQQLSTFKNVKFQVNVPHSEIKMFALNYIKNTIIYLQNNKQEQKPLNPKMKVPPKLQNNIKFKSIAKHQFLSLDQQSAVDMSIEKGDHFFSQNYNDILSTTQNRIWFYGFENVFLWIIDLTKIINELEKYGLFVRTLNFENTIKLDKGYKMKVSDYALKIKKVKDEDDSGLFDLTKQLLMHQCSIGLLALFLPQQSKIMAAVKEIYDSSATIVSKVDSLLQLLKKEMINHYKKIYISLIKGLLAFKSHSKSLTKLEKQKTKFILNQLQMLDKKELNFSAILINLKNIDNIKLSQYSEELKSKSGEAKRWSSSSEMERLSSSQMSSMRAADDHYYDSSLEKQQLAKIKKIDVFGLDFDIKDIFSAQRHVRQINPELLQNMLDISLQFVKYFNKVVIQHVAYYKSYQILAYTNNKPSRYRAIMNKGQKQFSLKWKKYSDKIYTLAQEVEMLCKLGKKSIYCWLISMINIITELESKNLMHADIQIRNTIKLKYVFLCIDFDFALKLTTNGGLDKKLYQKSVKIIKYWLETKDQLQIDTLSYFFFKHIEAQALKIKKSQASLQIKFTEILQLLKKNLRKFHFNQFFLLLNALVNYFQDPDKVSSLSQLSKFELSNLCSAILTFGNNQNYSEFRKNLNLIYAKFSERSQQEFQNSSVQSESIFSSISQLRVQKQTYSFQKFLLQFKSSIKSHSHQIRTRLFKNTKIFIGYLIKNRSNYFSHFYSLTEATCIQDQTADFTVTYRNDSYKIRNVEDVVDLGKRYVYSWLISMAHIIQQLQKLGIYHLKIEFSSIVREAERFKLHGLQAILATPLANENQELVNNSQQILFYLRLSSAQKMGQFLKYYFKDVEMIKMISNVFKCQAKIRLKRIWNNLHLTMKNGHLNQYIKLARELITASNKRHIFTNQEQRKLGNLLSRVETKNITYFQFCNQSEKLFYEYKKNDSFCPS